LGCVEVANPGRIRPLIYLRVDLPPDTLTEGLALPQCGVMETVAVVLMVLGPIGVGSALVVLVRLRGQLE
jgi:hypothetical protein